MEKKGARLFQQDETSPGNIVELDLRRQLRLRVNELIQLVNDPALTTGEIRERLLHGEATFGSLFAAHLVRSLHRHDPQERQSIVWLLTMLDDRATIQPLVHMSHNPQIPRAIRLSASLALAGMGATRVLVEAESRRPRLYAIS